MWQDSDLWDIDKSCDYYRGRHESMRKAHPLIRIWINDPENSHGAVCVGRVDFTDTIKGSFPFKNNTATQGVLQIRDDHYIALFLKRLPQDERYQKNVMITVDFYGGAKRWSGLLDKWNIKTTEDGAKYFEMTFQDDLTYLQYLLCPPNPFLPIPVFQFPRMFMLAGPSKWAISMLILLNLLRVEGNLWELPDDPFDPEEWDQILDWSDWQVHIKGSPWLVDDSSMWTFLSARMNPVDAVIADALDDCQLTMTYRRVLTDDGEVADGLMGIADGTRVKNGALVFEVVDNSNAHAFDGTFLSGTVIDGFARSLITYGGGFVEDVFNQVGEDSTLHPDEYYQSGWLGTIAKQPWLVIRDSEWTPITSSDMSWGPSKNVSVVVGGDNPAADAIAKLIIETTGALIGYFLLAGFSGLGSIAADVIMPFLVGTIAAWLQWKNTGRANALGWMHYWELYQAGAENNSWSLAALSALRGGFLVGKSETTHLVALHDSWAIPGLHFDIGHRIGTTVDSPGVQDIVWVNQVEEMVAEWDNSGDGQPYAWVIKAGKSQRNMSVGERLARLSKKFLDAINNVGVHLVQG
ncbi:minor tail protein [Mycobacterium phage CELFI]|uniref:Minor tail protein n=1 Tax=Mycobacterium phage CELFI TaxID=2769359 RepID=A0A7G9V439_9CAUD|nr:minor tail protein [Mycobacterium phage CELFI]QNO01045.1 minor tail protein [Mycobacterium phage CELFI]